MSRYKAQYKLGGEVALLNTLIQAKKYKASKNPILSIRVIKCIRTTYENNMFMERSLLVHKLDEKIPEKVEGYLTVSKS